MRGESKLFKTFFYQCHQIRTVEHKGETWWVASDVYEVLEIANSRQAINGNEKAGDSGLDEDEKGVLIQYTPGGPQATLYVNEPGLYHLISKSRTPEAKTFGRWVRHEVLPSIRKTGHYSLALPEYQNDHVGISDTIGRERSIKFISEAVIAAYCSQWSAMT